MRIGAHGIMIIYDITCRDSFINVDKWMRRVKKYSPKYSVKILIGNKSDQETRREVSYEEGKKMASKYGILFLEISAKTKFNVKKAFMLLAEEIMKKIRFGPLSLGLYKPLKKAKKAVVKPGK